MAFFGAIATPAQALDTREDAVTKLSQVSEECKSAITQPILSPCKSYEYLVEFRSEEAQLRINQHLRGKLTGKVESSLVSAFLLGPLELTDLARSKDVLSITKNVSVFSTGTQVNPDWHLDRIDQAGPILDSTYN